LIKTVNLTKKFGAQVAVDNLSLEVKEGEIFGFVGPNGAGKTTTIKLLTGLLKPTSGQIYIRGLSLEKNLLQIKRMIGYIPDLPFFYEKLTPIEFLDFLADLHQLPRGEKEKRITFWLNFFNLTPWQNTLIKDLSHGLRQRIVFGSAFLHQPKLVIIDEPMVGLDPHTAWLVKDLFRKKSAEGVTFFISTHTLELVEEICHRVGIIHQGKLITVGTIEELKKLNQRRKLEDVFLALTKS
jgi:ABC-2 type transport system ATP-binding protein